MEFECYLTFAKAKSELVIEAILVHREGGAQKSTAEKLEAPLLTH